jgi:hypothetical protein
MAVNVDALEESDAVEKIASSRELRKTKVGLLPPPVSQWLLVAAVVGPTAGSGGSVV